MKATRINGTINVPATIYEWTDDLQHVPKRLEVLEYGEYFYYVEGELREHGLFETIDRAEILGTVYEIFVEDSDRLFIAFGYDEVDGTMIRPGKRMLVRAGVLEGYHEDDVED